MSKEIAFGFGNTVDYELIWSTEVINKLIKVNKISLADLKIYDLLDSEKKIVISILFCMQKGIGIHLPIASNELLEDFSNHFKKNITLGGTGVRAALALSKIGVDSIVHLSQTNKYTRKLLPTNCEYYCSNKEDWICPHVIIQYTENSIIDSNDIQIKPVNANRIILSNDLSNSELKLNKYFYEEAIKNAKVLQLGCFESMEKKEVLDTLYNYLNKQIPIIKEQNTIIFMEMGHHHHEIAKEYFFNKLIFHADILSMNEDEFQDIIGKNIDLMDPKIVLNYINLIKEKYKLKYVVVHSRYWAIAIGEKANLLRESLIGGITLATTRLIHGDNFNIEDYKNTKKLPLQDKSQEFVNKLNNSEEISSFSSYEVTNKNLTTIGLGDTFVGGFLNEIGKLNRELLKLE